MIHPTTRPLRKALALATLLCTGQVVLAQTSKAYEGTWAGEIPLPFDPRPAAVRVGLEADTDGALAGAMDSDFTGPGLAQGRVDGESVNLVVDFGRNERTIRLTPIEGGKQLHALFVFNGFPIPFVLEREADEWVEALRFEVSPPAERPQVVTLDGLPDFWMEEIEQLVQHSLDSEAAVGLALAVVVDGELLDHRSWGWRDVRSEDPVDGETLFRWASISKSITGLVAAKMAVAGKLDLDADVRKLVPEFPEKEHMVTARLLLGHLGGIAHYQHLPRVTRIDYGEPFPFRDPVRAIDMFREAPLIHQPGSQYSYSTHGYALAGAVLERSSKDGFKTEVERLIKTPLGMASFEPDDPTDRRSMRTLGYRVATDGRVFESGDTDISWKLAGGGFQSTAADLARFGAGLCDPDYVADAVRELLWTPMQTTDGTDTGYGFGFSIGNNYDRLQVSHSGGQRRTSTFLLVFPDEGVAIALMCNTEGAGLSGLAHRIARVVLGIQ